MTISSRRRAMLALLAAGFVLGGCSAVFGDRQSSKEPGQPSVAPLPDERAMEQVVTPAAQIAKVAKLRDVYGGFSFASCNDQGEPPYKGLVEMSFTLPTGVEVQAYFSQISKTMVAHGWTDGPPPGKQPFGVVIHTEAVMAVMTAGPKPGWAKAQLHGECRNMTDHRNDGKTNWVDITNQLTGS